MRTRATIERAGTAATWFFAWAWVGGVAFIAAGFAGGAWGPAAFVWVGLGAFAALTPIPVMVHLLSRVLVELRELRTEVRVEPEQPRGAATERPDAGR